jgi:predicted restriction endonuclease
MFDEGLWTVDEKERILVAEEVFTEWGPDTEWLKARHHQKLTFMDGVTLRPNPKNLAWHREKVFERV